MEILKQSMQMYLPHSWQQHVLVSTTFAKYDLIAAKPTQVPFPGDI